MQTNRSNNENSSGGHAPNTKRWLVAFVTATVVGALGLGSLPARDLQPITQQHSLGGELNYLLTHREALVHLLPFAIVYTVLVTLYSFVGQVLHYLVPRWSADLAGIVDSRVRLHLTHFNHRYRVYLRNHLTPLDQKGLPDPGWDPDLDQVFVDLTVARASSIEGQANPIQALSPELEEGQHHLFSFLGLRRSTSPHLVIIGPPGSGKTTLLRHTALVLVSGRSAMVKMATPPSLRRLTPILLYVREHVSQVQKAVNAQLNTGSSDGPYSLEEAVNHQLRLHVSDLSIPKGWLAGRLRRGRCLVLLDGLDEIADSNQRRLMANWIQDQMDAYRRCRFVVTSRPHGYKGNTLNGVTVLNPQPYTRTQIRSFVQKWYLASKTRRGGSQNDPAVKSQAQAEALEFLRRVDDLPDIYELATNPLLLTMICIVHQHRGTLPKKRVELYKDACEVFLIGRQRAKGLDVSLAEHEGIGILAPLAWAMMCNPELSEDGRRWPEELVKQAISEPVARLTNMDSDSFLQYIHETGLFIELEPGEFGFAHLTFQEYLAAVHALASDKGPDLVAHIGDSWWEETICLYCARADANRAIDLIKACLPQGDELPSGGALTVALACLGEAPPRARAAMEGRVREVIDRCAEASDRERQHIAGEVLLDRRLRDMVYLAERTRYSPTLVTCAEYQVFIDETPQGDRDRVPLHWTSNHFPAGYGLKPVLGVMAEDATAFCSWLTNKNKRRHGAFRVPYGEEIGQQSVQNALRILDMGFDVWYETRRNTVALTLFSKPPNTGNHLEMASVIVQRDTETTACSYLCDALLDRYLASVQSYSLAYGMSINSENRNAIKTLQAFERNPGLDIVPANAQSGYDQLLGYLVHARDIIRQLRTFITDARDVAQFTVSNWSKDPQPSLHRDRHTNLINMRAKSHELARRLVSELSLARDVAVSLSMETAFAVNFFGDLTNTLTSAGDHCESVVHDLSRSGAYAREFALTESRSRGLDLISALDSAGRRCDSLNRIIAAMFTLVTSYRQGKFRLCLLILIDMLAHPFDRTDAVRHPSRRLDRELQSSSSRTSAESNLPTRVASLVDIYVALIIIEGRIQGWLQPTEGILIVCDTPQAQEVSLRLTEATQRTWGGTLV